MISLQILSRHVNQTKIATPGSPLTPPINQKQGHPLQSWAIALPLQQAGSRCELRHQHPSNAAVHLHHHDRLRLPGQLRTQQLPLHLHLKHRLPAQHAHLAAPQSPTHSPLQHHLAQCRHRLHGDRHSPVLPRDTLPNCSCWYF